MKKITLKNGMTVVLDKVDSIKSVTFGYWIKAGSINEKKEEYGIAHFLEHMLFRTSENYTHNEIKIKLDLLGEFNGATGNEDTHYYIKTLEEDCVEAATVMTDMIFRPKLIEEEIETERGVVLEELNMYLDNEMFRLGETVRGNIFNEEYSHSPIGKREVIETISKDMLRDFHNRYYNPDNIVAVIVGNISEKDFDAIVEIMDAVEPNGVTPEHKMYDQDLNKDIMIHILQDKNDQVNISFDQILPFNFTNDDTLRHPMNLLVDILTSGLNSILMKKLREELGLVYNVAGTVINMHNTNAYASIFTQTSIENTDLVVQTIKDVLDNILKNGIPLENLNRMKKIYKRADHFSIEKSSIRFTTLGKSFLKNRNNTRTIDDIIEEAQNVTYRDFNTAIKYLCDTSKYHIHIQGKLEFTEE